MIDKLTVQPELLDVLALRHENVAALTSSGIDVAAGLGKSVETTHGSYCSQFNNTLKMYENTRNALGSSLHAASVCLAKSLRAAGNTYHETDETCGKNISSVFG
ncbi:secretion protein EspC [Mycobacterium uberis]|uniref:Secretion protein EspC n=1 Tax=Mycobacterium uberis TaxID=2162698 RepID=A0A3E1HBP7_9MYCO|nr:ESX-1 secretion-associated protein [Mycobacterium uberis]RFD23872.1 secretion protein EspC [Mycobacterium uberis]